MAEANVLYVGITDFMAIAQVEDMRGEVRGLSGHVLHVGVMASYKTIRGIPNRWPNRFPPCRNIASIFRPHEKVFNVLHYASTEDLDDLLPQLQSAGSVGGPNMQGLQLDICWPDPEAVLAYQGMHPEIKIILQVGPKAMRQMDLDPKKIADRIVREYPTVDYALLDNSAGRGVGMDWTTLRRYILELRTAGYKHAITVAGGLGPHSLHLVAPLVREFPDISIDAEGALRKHPDDPVDWEMARSYLRQALRLFSSGAA